MEADCATHLWGSWDSLYDHFFKILVVNVLMVTFSPMYFMEFWELLKYISIQHMTNFTFFWPHSLEVFKIKPYRFKQQNNSFDNRYIIVTKVVLKKYNVEVKIIFHMFKMCLNYNYSCFCLIYKCWTKISLNKTKQKI